MRSEQIKTGVERTPNRSLLYALGYTDEELARPLIGVVSSYNEIVPGHMGLDKIAEAVKAGIRAAGGTPVMFPAIAVCDGIAMGHVGMKYSLVTRDLIADSTEAMVMAHQFDGLVMIPNCDKNVPGLLMAAARLNIPTIFCSGGPMLAGRLKDGRRTCLSHMFEAVGAYHAGKLDEAGVADYTENACPTCGSCSGMYTANSMNCLTEAIGMGPPGQRHHSRRVLRPAAAGQADRHEDHGAGGEKHPSPGHHDGSRLPQRRDRGHGAGLLHQHHAAPARHRSRGRGGAGSAHGQRASATRLPTSAIWLLPVTPISRIWTGPAASGP